MNPAASPCNNFFEYACGNRRQPISFAELTIANLAAIDRQLRDNEYVEQVMLIKIWNFILLIFFSFSGSKDGKAGKTSCGAMREGGKRLGS
jgi:hypothetical protein